MSLNSRLLPFWLLFCFTLVTGCGGGDASARSITLATTTSTRDSGLLDVLLPMFQQQTGIAVKVVAVGSGQALELGRRGDADVLLTHAPAAEQQFVADGHGVQRQLVMHNDFVLVGPQADPAQVSQKESIQAVFAHMATTQSPFVSRGDESGTHKKEQKLWKEAKIAPQGEWYIQAGSGMAQTLRMAGEREAYTLTDRGTFLFQQDKLQLVILSAGDVLLRNQYAVIVISPQNHPHVQADAGQQFADFLLSPKVQSVIENYGVEQFGEPLFFPNVAERNIDLGPHSGPYDASSKLR